MVCAGLALDWDFHLTGCLLSCYRLLYLFGTCGSELEGWKLERSVWVFVCNMVADDDGYGL